MSRNADWDRRFALRKAIRLSDSAFVVEYLNMASLGDVLANNIRAERARRRLTQAQLGDLLGWPRTSIHDVEAGRRKLSPDDLVTFCRGFGITLLELAHGADPEDLRTLGLRG